MPALLPSELPVVAYARHHGMIVLRPPQHWQSAVALLVLFVWGLLYPAMLVVLVLLLGVNVYIRWRTWRAEQIILTQKRIMRVQGIPETTNTEASLRIDRISGMRLIETVPGKVLHYGTIELEAPGNHPDVRRLIRIKNPNAFYVLLRNTVFGELRPSSDPDDMPPAGDTQRLPRLGPPPVRKP